MHAGPMSTLEALEQAGAARAPAAPLSPPCFVSPDDGGPIRPGLEALAVHLARHGLQTFADNVRGAQMQLIRAEGRLLPVIVTTRKAGDCSSTSLIGHHVAYPLEYLAEHRWLGWAARLAKRPLAAALGVLGLDETAQVNHWIVTAPNFQLRQQTWRDIARIVAARHPDRAVLVRGIVPDLAAGQLDALAAAGGVGLPSRRIYLFDPSVRRSGRRMRSVRQHINTALRQIKEGDRRRRVAKLLEEHDYRRMEALYRASYCERTKLNIAYRAEFFRALATIGEADFAVWEDDSGEIEAFDVAIVDGAQMLWSAFGVAQEHKRAKGLYHLVIARSLKIAFERGGVANLGAAADEYKRLRGGTPTIEWDFVFFDHLPWPRRALWRSLAWFRRRRAGVA